MSDRPPCGPASRQRPARTADRRVLLLGLELLSGALATAAAELRRADRIADSGRGSKPRAGAWESGSKRHRGLRTSASSSPGPTPRRAPGHGDQPAAFRVLDPCWARNRVDGAASGSPAPAGRRAEGLERWPLPLARSEPRWRIPVPAWPAQPGSPPLPHRPGRLPGRRPGMGSGSPPGSPVCRTGARRSPRLLRPERDWSWRSWPRRGASAGFRAAAAGRRNGWIWAKAGPAAEGITTAGADQAGAGISNWCCRP